MTNESKKMGEKLIAFLLAVSVPLSLSGCSKKAQEQQEDVHRVFLSEQVKPEVVVTKDYQQLLENFYMMMPVIDFENLYLKGEEIARVLEEENRPMVSHEEIDLQTVYEQILKNSLAGDNSSFLKEANMQAAIREALNAVFKTPSDYQEDWCLMQELVIKEGDLEGDLIAIYLEDKNEIVLDYVKIKRYGQEHLLKHYLEHELNHCRQFICKHRKALGEENTSIERGLFKELIESAAESQTISEKDLENDRTHNYIYQQEREYETLLFLLVAFKDNKKIEEYYQAIFNSDINGLWQFFELDSNEEKLKFANMYYEMVNNKGINYLKEIFMEANYDILKQITKNKLSLEEALYLHNFLKTVIQKKCQEEEIREVIKENEEKFYEFLQSFYQVPRGEIEAIEERSFYNFKALYSLKYGSMYDASTNIDINKLKEMFGLLKIIEWTHEASYADLLFLEEEPNRSL